MSNVELAFVILNCFLLGLGASVVHQVLVASKGMRDSYQASLKVKEECLELTKTIGAAHNSMAKRLLELEDKQKAVELRQNTKANPFLGQR